MIAGESIHVILAELSLKFQKLSRPTTRLPLPYSQAMEEAGALDI
jgi:hypothetical protein